MTNTSQSNSESTIGDKLNALSHYGIFGQSLHVLLRNLIPSKFFVTNTDQKKWEEYNEVVY